MTDAQEPAIRREETVAIISDTHLPRGRRELPARCLQLLRAADAIVHAGDISTTAVLAQLSALGPPVVAVCGNVDEPALQSRLPIDAELELGGVRVGITHDAGSATGRVSRLRDRFPACHGVVFGHSHIPLHEHEDDFQIFNPGSPTDRRRQPERTMGLARISEGAIRFEHVSLGV